MSNGFFILDSAKLEDIKKKLSTASTTLEGYNTTIYDKVASLGSSWQGPSYDAFVNDATNFKPALEELVDLFSQYSNTVSELEEQGNGLVADVAANLDCSALITLGDNVYKAEDIGDYYGSNLSYTPDISNVKTPKDAYNQAIEVRDNLYYDIGLINNEIQNEKDALAALEANRSKMDKDVYDALLNQANRKIEELNGYLGEYMEAYNTVDGLTSESSLDIIDFITGKGGDGKIHEASDGWFGYGDSLEDATDGLRSVVAAISNLTPVSVVTDSSSLVGTVSNTDHRYDLFLNGTNVSKTAMEAAYNIAENSQGGTEVIAPGVVAFNSSEFVSEGQQINNNIFGSSYTFSQNQAYSDYGEIVKNDNGFDSVKITTADGETKYMTYSQYLKQGYNTESVDAVTSASESVESKQ